MKTEQAKKLTDESLERLAEALKQGQSDVMRQYLAAMAKFHRYSFGNILLIYVQRPTATHVAGFHTWKKLGRYVRKGESGIAILAPMMLKAKIEEGEGNQTGDRDAEPRPVLRFRAVCVFDVSQTDGDVLPQPTNVRGEPGEFIAALKQLIDARHITLEYAEMYGTGDGFSSGGRIVVRKDMPPAQEFAVLVHELAHEMLHQGSDRSATTKTTRETEAEAVAYVVSQAIGLDTNTASSDYIQLYRGDAATLAGSLDRIQRTSAAIIAVLLPEAESHPTRIESAAVAGEVRP
jgi:antirestriction protein ArdC